jgi:hypothetical protein
MRSDETILKLYSEDKWEKLTTDEKLRLIQLRAKDELHNN